jgi:hypothetical protein
VAEFDARVKRMTLTQRFSNQTALVDRQLVEKIAFPGDFET